jgi:hypothetical protein
MRIIICALLLISLISVASGASLVVSIGDIQGSPGSTVQVPIMIEGATDVGSVDIMLKYDASVLKAVSVETSDLGKNAIMESNLANPGQVNIALVDASGINGEGEIATISFSVLGETGASSPLSLVEASVFDLELVEQQTTISNGAFTVAESKGAGYAFFLITLIAAVLAAMVIRKN